MQYGYMYMYIIIYWKGAAAILRFSKRKKLPVLEGAELVTIKWKLNDVDRSKSFGYNSLKEIAVCMSKSDLCLRSIPLNEQKKILGTVWWDIPRCRNTGGYKTKFPNILDCISLTSTSVMMSIATLNGKTKLQEADRTKTRSLIAKEKIWSERSHMGRSVIAYKQDRRDVYQCEICGVWPRCAYAAPR